MTLSLGEIETGINYNMKDKLAIVYTADRYLQIKLDKLCKSFPNDFKHITLVGDDKEIKSYHINKKFVSIRTPKIISEKEMARYKKQGKDLSVLMAKRQTNMGAKSSKINLK